MATDNALPIVSPPGPRGLPIVGNVLEAQRDFLGFCQRLARDYGDVASFRLAHFQAFLVSHPEIIQQVLQDKGVNYGKNPFHHAMAMILGNGLLTCEHEDWKVQRKMLQPMFHRDKIMKMTETMAEIAQTRLPVWEEHHLNGTTMDMHEEMTNLTLDIMLTTMFGSTLSAEDNRKVAQAMSDTTEFAMQKPNQPIDIPTWVPLPQNKKLKRARKILNDVILKLVKERDTSTEDHADLLSMLREARTEEGEGLTAEEMRDQMATFIFAGHETTATHLAWTWLLLSQHPQVFDKLREELNTVVSGDAPTLDELMQLKYTKMVLEESLRVYPTVWTYGRRTLRDHKIRDFHIPEKSLIFISIHTMHHHPDYWDEPDQFRPERFENPELKSGVYKHVYFPFGVGPRTCIGNHFAITESIITLATLAKQFRPTLLPGHRIATDPLITLRPKYGIKMTIEK